MRTMCIETMVGTYTGASHKMRSGSCGGRFMEICSVPHGCITCNKGVTLECVIPHVFHGGDSLDKYWDAQDLGYVLGNQV